MKQYIPLITFIFFCVMTIVGIVLGESQDVFQKAIAICLSCIGIG